MALILQPPTPDHVVHPDIELYADVELNTTTEPGEDGFSKGTNTVPLKWIWFPILLHCGLSTLGP